MTITEAQLMQLRLDILEAAEGATKPVAHHIIGDWLAGTPSRDFVRYNLRVIDALVGTGELVRHINTEGGRNTYSVGRVDPAPSRRVLLKLFADDLADSGTAATPAAPPVHTVPPKLSNPALAATPLPNVTRIDRNAKPEPYRPTDPIRARILGLIDEARHCSRAYLVSRLWDVQKANIDNHLWACCKSGLLIRVGEGEYARPEGATAANSGTSVAPKAAPKPAARPAVKESLTAGPVAAALAPPAGATPTPRTESAGVTQPGRAGKGGRPQGAKAKSAAASAEKSAAADQSVPAATLPPADYEGPVIGLDGARYYLKDVVVSHSPAAIAPGKAFTIGSMASAANLPHCARRVAVLRRLAPMLAPDIGEELHAIADYIEQARVAA